MAMVEKDTKSEAVATVPIVAASAQLSELNKQIMEIKKKIQLSEGQRKALFEECETERKSNADEILQLKKEIAQLIVTLHESKCPTANYLIRNKRIEEIIGPLDNKTVGQVKDLLDLQIIDKSKQLDLIKYKIKKRKEYLASLGEEYQKYMREEERKQLAEKERPIKRSTKELQNSIHAVEVQIREANHIKARYTDIRKSLKDDSSKFESNINRLQEQLDKQNDDIKKLQKIMDEATKTRALARTKLTQEEKSIQMAAHKREKEAMEGKRLVNERKAELERLERKLFPVGRVPVRPEPEGAEEGQNADEEKPESPPNPFEELTQCFETLKRTTGATSTEEVLERFQMQKQTEDRLNYLRKMSEREKKDLVKKCDQLKRELESYRYAEAKEAEKRTLELDQVQNQIQKVQSDCKTVKEKKEDKIKAIESLAGHLNTLHVCINPLAISSKDALEVLKQIEKETKCLLEKIGKKEVIKQHSLGKMSKGRTVDLPEEKWLPALYNSILRKTPIPQSGSTPLTPVPGPVSTSDDEEEVPSRGYLKRQAQLVVDAKTRRKNMRIQLPKRN